MSLNLNSYKQCDGSSVELTEQQQLAIEDYIAKLTRWNGLNLVARSTEADIIGWHIKDALSIKCLLEDAQVPIIDFGAGGGVLGISLSIAGVKNIVLVERSKSKLTFLKDIMKFESAYAEYDFSHPCIVITRGVDKIGPMLDLFTAQNIGVQKLILLKAYDLRAEIRNAKRKYNCTVRIYKRRGRAHGSVVEITEISNK